MVCSVSELKNGIIQISGNERRPEKEREKWIFAMNCRWKCSNGHSSACRSLAYKTMGGTEPGGQRPIDLLALLLPNKHTTHTHSQVHHHWHWIELDPDQQQRNYINHIIHIHCMPLNTAIKNLMAKIQFGLCHTNSMFPWSKLSANLVSGLCSD